MECTFAIESPHGVMTDPAKLSEFHDALMKDQRVSGPSASVNSEFGVLSTTFTLLEVKDYDEAQTIALDVFKTAVWRIGLPPIKGGFYADEIVGSPGEMSATLRPKDPLGVGYVG